jgi:hypothetical protein
VILYWRFYDFYSRLCDHRNDGEAACVKVIVGDYSRDRRTSSTRCKDVIVIYIIFGAFYMIVAIQLQQDFDRLTIKVLLQLYLQYNQNGILSIL